MIRRLYYQEMKLVFHDISTFQNSMLKIVTSQTFLICEVKPEPEIFQQGLGLVTILLPT